MSKLYDLNDYDKMAHLVGMIYDILSKLGELDSRTFMDQKLG